MSNKLNDPILNRFLNNRKIPGDIITNISKKDDLFNKYFADQCIPLNNLNRLPPLYLKTDKKLCNLSINENYISAIIRNLDPSLMDGIFIVQNDKALWRLINLSIKMYL